MITRYFTEQDVNAWCKTLSSTTNEWVLISTKPPPQDPRKQTKVLSVRLANQNKPKWLRLVTPCQSRSPASVLLLPAPGNDPPAGEQVWWWVHKYRGINRFCGAGEILIADFLGFVSNVRSNRFPEFGNILRAGWEALAGQLTVTGVALCVSWTSVLGLVLPHRALMHVPLYSKCLLLISFVQSDSFFLPVTGHRDGKFSLLLVQTGLLLLSCVITVQQNGAGSRGKERTSAGRYPEKLILQLASFVHVNKAHVCAFCSLSQYFELPPIHPVQQSVVQQPDSPLSFIIIHTHR